MKRARDEEEMARFNEEVAERTAMREEGQKEEESGDEWVDHSDIETDE